MDTVKIPDKNKTRFIAHRGLSGLLTENTVEAFTAAGGRSYYGVECDVHVTSDGKYVIFHDDGTGRMCTENYKIEDTAFDIIRNLAFKDGVSRVPTLEEYLQVLSKCGKIAVIELKNSMRESNIREITEICGRLYSLDKIIFISFDTENLITVRKILPEQKIQLLTNKFDDGILKTLKEYDFGLDIGYRVLTDEVMERLSERGITVNCWTCDDKSAAERLIDKGIDFITTNILE